MRDVRLAFRRMRTRPGYAVPALLILGLGLGTSVAMFSFVEGLLLRPIALPHLPRLVTLWSVPVDQPEARGLVSAADLLDWKEQARTLESIAACQGVTVDLSGDGFPERLSGVRVWGDYFGTLGIQALHGRLFGQEANQPGNDGQVVLSESLWRRRYGADESIVGQRILLQGRSHVVTGIAPLAAAYPLGCEIWMPLVLGLPAAGDRSTRRLEVVGRGSAGASVASVEAELRVLSGRWAWQTPVGQTARTVRAVPLVDHLLANSEAPRYLPVVLMAAGFLLALACANVANLQVAQMHLRLREFVVRAALGASRGRLIRQVLTDSVVMGLMGGGVGLLVAYWTIHVIRGSLPADLLAYVPGWSGVGLNGPVFLFAAVTAVGTGLAAGLAPALAVPRHNLEEVMRAGARGSTRGGHRLRRSLVVLEVALALVLLVACGLVVKTFTGLIVASRGFDAREVLTMRIALPPARYATTEQVIGFFEAAVRELAALPGVRSAAVASTMPFYSRRETEYGRGPGRPEEGSEMSRCGLQGVSSDYFRTLGIRVLQGRAFGVEDRRSSARVAVVSERVARRCWPGESPLHRQLWLDPRSPNASPLTVIGVVGDVQDDWREEIRGTVYLPFEQWPEASMFIMLRTSGNPVGQAGAVRSTLRELDQHQPLLGLKPLRQVMVESMAGLYITSGVLAYMGLTALCVAAAGIYSVMANSVSQRLREMGIRSALGARRHDLLRLVLSEGMRFTVLGLILGLPLALAVGHWLRHAVFGVVALQLGWVGLLGALLLAVAGLACWLPARRAARVDPIIVLRYE
ncbi:MAG: ABC transporter permease [Verrucomicrobia bacterium]|nr:ABC transporter permease [Verrucomicrobiota bacterium]